MKGRMGELPKDAAELVLHQQSGTPSVPSPFFKGKTSASLPPEFEWLRDFKNELVESAVDAAARRVYKTRPPHWIEPPFDHTVIDRQARVNVPGGALPAVAILTLTIAHNEMARIKFYTQDINPVPPAVLPATAWQDVVWTFRVNGTPLPDYNIFTGQRGVAPWPAETTIILNDSDTFEIMAANNNAAALWITAGIRGWKWSTLSTAMPKEDILNTR